MVFVNPKVKVHFGTCTSIVDHLHVRLVVIGSWRYIDELSTSKTRSNDLKCSEATKLVHHVTATSRGSYVSLDNSQAEFRPLT